MTNLRKATNVGDHSVAWFRQKDGAVVRVVISATEYGKVTLDTDDTKEYLVDGRSVRPQSQAAFFKATTQIKWDTVDGFQQPGDYYEPTPGELMITLPRPDLSQIPLLVLDPGDWSGNANNPKTINADVTVGRVRYVISSGVLA